MELLKGIRYWPGMSKSQERVGKPGVNLPNSCQGGADEGGGGGHNCGKRQKQQSMSKYITLLETSGGVGDG